MLIIDFNQSAVQAFEHGFLKGMAAPVMLFHSESAPEIPQYVTVVAPDTPLRQSLLGDWYRIGDDMKKVISSHQHEQRACA